MHTYINTCDAYTNILEGYTNNFILVISGEWTKKSEVGPLVCYLIFLLVLEF